MKFFKRKSKAAQVSNDVITIAPSEAPSVTPSKSSRRSEFSKSSKSTKSKKSNTEPVEVDNRQELNAVAPPLDTETRDDIFFINTVTTSSGSDTDEEVSHLSFDEQVLEKTNMVKQYVVDHLLGCVDFVEECAQGTTKGGNRIDDRTTCVDNQTTSGVADFETVQEKSSLNRQQFSNNAAFLNGTSHQFESKTSMNHEYQSLFAHTDDSGPHKSTMIKPSTVRLEASQVTPSHANRSNDLLAYETDVLQSGYTDVKPKNSYEPTAFKSNNDFLLALTSIDAIIDSHVARLCQEMCACDEIGLCGGDDDISQFQDWPPVSNDHENMLFQ